AGAASGLRFELDTAAERVGELPRDREAEPRALAVARPEGTKDALLLLERDPRAAVADAEGETAVLGVEGERDLAAVGGPLERVHEQVGDNLEHAVAVRRDHRRLAHVLPVADFAPLGLLGERLVGLLEQPLEVDLLVDEG